MQGRLKSALRSAAMAAGIAVSLFMFVPTGSTAPAADNCLTAPNAPAPQGSHWYYRLERGTQRKCWRLVQKDQKGPSTAARTAPQPEGDDEADDAPAPAASAPAAKMPAALVPTARAAEPAAPPSQAIVRDLFTRNVSNTDQPAQPLAAPTPPTVPTTPCLRCGRTGGTNSQQRAGTASRYPSRSPSFSLPSQPKRSQTHPRLKPCRR